MNIAHAAVALAALVLAACSSNATDPNTPPTPDPEPPAVKKPYDTARGGLQITAIYYDQARNLSVDTLEDEWIVLETLSPVRTAGWSIDAGDAKQRFPLPDTIRRALRIYTKNGPPNPTGEVLALHRGSWIWNNAEPDTARLYDASGNVVDIMTYDNK